MHYNTVKSRHRTIPSIFIPRVHIKILRIEILIIKLNSLPLITVLVIN